MAYLQKHKAAMEKFVATHNGRPVDRKILLNPDQGVMKVLIARFLSMSREQQKSLKSIATPETASALKILLPEFKDLVDKGVSHG